MDQKEEDIGSLTMVLERFTEYRLPRAERMLDRVNAGERLTDIDLNWLKRINAEGRYNRDLIRRNPEYHELATRMVDLYSQIMEKALENEQALRKD
ncbi:MAG: hypothetical protein AAGH19_01350 [Pseudomonadota bacterium]